MAHTHDHGNKTTYYVEQIVTIATCGALAGVCILLFLNRQSLSGMLNTDQHLRVLFGGVGLLILVLIRATHVWIAAGKTNAKAADHAHEHGHDHDHSHCGHDHDHDHAHGDHDHAHCDHDHHHHDHKHETAVAVKSHDHAHHHGHDHSHGLALELPAEKNHNVAIPTVAQGTNDVAVGDHDHAHDHHGHDHSHGLAPWRFALLLLPVVLFLLGLPAVGGMNASNVKDIAGELGGLGNTAGKDKKSAAGFNVGGAGVFAIYGEDKPNFAIGFNTLDLASRNAETREAVAGTMIQLRGQYKGEHPEYFTLVRFRINCCAADAIPLKAVITIDPKMSGKFKIDPAKYSGKWIQVTGKVQFKKIGKEWIPVIYLSPKSQSELETEIVKEIPPDNNPYAND